MIERSRLAAFLSGITPTSALVCSVDGDPAPAGGGSPAPSPDPAVAPPAPLQFTAEQLAYIAAERQKAHDTGAAGARRAEREAIARRGGDTTPANPAPPNGAPAPQSNPPPAVFDADTFNDVLSEFPFDREQRGVIRDAARRENPANLDEFVSRWGRMFGKSKGGAQPVNPAPGPAPGTTPAPPPVASPSSSPPSRVVTEDTRIVDMPVPDRVALAARIGNAAYRARLRTEMAADTRRARVH